MSVGITICVCFNQLVVCREVFLELLAILLEQLHANFRNIPPQEHCKLLIAGLKCRLGTNYHPTEVWPAETKTYVKEVLAKDLNTCTGRVTVNGLTRAKVGNRQCLQRFVISVDNIFNDCMINATCSTPNALNNRLNCIHRLNELVFVHC